MYSNILFLKSSQLLSKRTKVTYQTKAVSFTIGLTTEFMSNRSYVVIIDLASFVLAHMRYIIYGYTGGIEWPAPYRGRDHHR